MRPVILGIMLTAGSSALAHQPVMDMAPRWAGGYGFQTRIEHFDSETTSWLEGIYTFDRALRATFKLPVRHGRPGGLVLGMPLKSYRNAGAVTSNWSLTPSVQFPTGYEEEWDFGLSVSYSAETPRFYQMYDLYTWRDRTGLDINAGFAFPGQNSGIFALWDVSILQSREGDRVQTGPVFVYFRDNVMFRAEYKALVYEHDSSWSGGFINLGVGIVF